MLNQPLLFRRVILRVYVRQLERADRVNLDLGEPAHRCEMGHVLRSYDEPIILELDERVLVKIFAESHQEGAPYPRNGLIGWMCVRRQEVPVGKAKAPREYRARHAGIALDDGELSARWKNRRRRPPVDLGIVIHLTVFAGR